MPLTDEKTVDLSVIIVSYNTQSLLARAITALQQSAADFRFEIIIVDNASKDGSAAYIQTTFPWCQLIANTANVGFGRANNQALSAARGRYVLLLNTDAVVAPDSVSTAIAYMDANARCGIAGVRLVDGDGAPQPCARFFPTPLNLFVARAGLRRFLPWVRMVDDPAWDQAAPRKCDWVPGCFYLVRKQLIDEVGLFDPRYFLYYEEVDHCLAAKRAGWDVVCVPHTTVMHLGGESIKSEAGGVSFGRQLAPLFIESELLFFRKNLGLRGMLADLFLTLMAAQLNAMRRLMRNRSSVDSLSFRHAALMMVLLVKTHGGMRATR